jgi:Ser-tRNA(Ala) deacylase AlaX
MMMLGRTELLYLDDSYLREFKARVVDVIADGVILDRTSFHPAGGGLLSDKGMISYAGSISEVAEVLQDGENILHRIAGSPPSIGEEVEAWLDWDRRYAMMRLHTAIHVLAAVMMKKTSAAITGNSIGPEQARVDFSVESFDRAVLEECVADANRLLQEGKDVKIHYMEREKVLATPGLVKLAARMPPNIPVLRLVEIVGVDIQADGGPHVRNTREVGKMRVLKLENKGRANRRLYLAVE